VKGDAMRFGDVVAISANGEVAFAYRSTYVGDHPPMRDIANPH
jgi:hypothetical protein